MMAWFLVWKAKRALRQTENRKAYLQATLDKAASEDHTTHSLTHLLIDRCGAYHVHTMTGFTCVADVNYRTSGAPLGSTAYVCGEGGTVVGALRDAVARYVKAELKVLEAKAWT